MQATDVSHLSISEAAALIQARSVSPTELTEDYLRRIEQLNPRLNAYVEVTADRARSDARQATAEISGGTYRGPLHGVPIGLKDLYDTAGIRTAGGARILMDRVPQKDSTVARKLREAGSVLLGKLNTHELAFGVTTNNPHFGATHNPWNVDAIPGGSSGGSGAAIAAGLAVATTGTDTGGSIRIPASLMWLRWPEADVWSGEQGWRAAVVLATGQSRADYADRGGRRADAAGDGRVRPGRLRHGPGAS